MNKLYAMDTHFMGANQGPDPDTQARLVKDVGYDAYYVTSDLHTPDKSLDYARASRGAGLDFDAVFMRLDSAATPTDTDVRAFRRVVEALESPTRIEFSAWHHAFGERVGDPSTDAGTLAWLKALLPVLEEHGMRAALYPHFMFSLETFADALRLLQALPHELLGVQFCGYHWYRCEGTPVRELFDRAGDRLFGVNLCGCATVNEGEQIHELNPMIQPLDEGDMDNADVLAALGEIGYTGPIGVQGYDVTAPAEEALRRSLAALRGMLTV